MPISRVHGLAVLVAAAALARPALAASPTPGAIAPDRLKLPSGPSSVRGLADEPEVDPFWGQISHSVPIEVPEGHGRLAPALALTYSGALGNGALGIGWTMPGARIERSQRLGVPAFDASDELELSGPASGRLIAIGGGQYRVEGMGHTVRVRAAGAGFEVDGGDGTRWRFGVGAAARQDGGGRTVAWLVEEQTNLAGERVAYEYLRDQGQVYLSRVSWGPQQVFVVELSYAARPDVTTSYREGFRVVTARRLDRIRVLAFGAERRAYRLHYDNSFSVSRLAGVTSTGRDGAGAWPALAFDYATPGTPAVAPIPGVGAWRLNANGITLVDLDGDGAADLLELADGGHSYRLNQNGAFGAALPVTGNTLSIASLQLMDLDGDARAELVQETGTGWAVWKWSKTKWLPQPLPGGVWPGSAGLALKNPATTRFADLDGDGLIEAIQWDNDSLKIFDAGRAGLGAPREVPRIGGALLPTGAGRFQDENGDGLDDYLVLQPDRLDVYTGRGDGTFDPVQSRAYPFPGALPSPDDIHLVDLDRDDLMDLVRVDLGTVRWFRGRADGGFDAAPITVASPEPLSADVVVAISDVNGNGSHDVVWSSATGMWSLDVAGPTTAGMLARTRNGLGLEASFAYRSAHAISVDARLAGDPWLSELPIAMPVPVRKVTAVGAGEPARQIDYLVRDGAWDAVERRFGGFLGTLVTTWGATPAQTSTVQRRHHNGTGANRALRGKVLVEQVRDGTGRRLSMTIHTWEAVLATGLPDVPVLRKAVLRDSRTRYEDVAPVRESRVSYEYDALGRARRSVDHGRLDMTGDESVRETRYADDDTTWVRDQLCEDKLLSLAGELVSHQQILYGDEAELHPLCAIGKGWVRDRRSWLAEEARFVSQGSTRYDARGNPIETTASGVTRQIGYDPTGLFAVSERVELGGDALVTTARWDPVLGLATEVTDASGHRTRASYDALGRTIGFAVGDRPEHLVITYDWQDAFPRTTIHEFDGPAEQLGAPPAWSETGGWRQTVEVSNGKGELRYRARRLAQARWIISDYKERDPASRVVFVGQPVHADRFELAARPPEMVGQVMTYDPLGRLLEQRLPGGSHRLYSYGSFDRTVREDSLAQVHHVLDGKGRITLTERQLASGAQRVEASYDAAGRVTRMSLQGGAVVRTFRYDTLGRLLETRDPDAGVHAMRYDDGNRIVEQRNGAGQAVTFGYDAAGRLRTRDSGAGQLVRFHYDAAPGGTATGLRGRLAWVEEPTGQVELSYDASGRTVWARRTIDGRSAAETTVYAASGLVLARRFDDGLELDYRYDPAGRLVAIGDVWELTEQDAAGRALEERFGNGVVSRFGRDALGLIASVDVRDVTGASVYDVDVHRNDWSAIDAVVDGDGVGLDHSATFAYDDFARLTAATVGVGAAAFQFSYSYDGLQNMIARGAGGPHAIGALTGQYRYGEAGAGPRQLTSILGAGGAIHSFGYDAAGRQVVAGDRTLEFDALDQLLRVSGAAGSPGSGVVHAYGHDGLRVKTVSPQGTGYWFSETLSERDGVREHDIVVGDRVVARVSFAAQPGASAAPAAVGALVAGVPLGLGALFLAAALVGVGRRRRPLRLCAALTAAFVLASACAGSLSSSSHALAWAHRSDVYLHVGIGAGPAVFTDGDGRLLEERRFEPFGEDIDANRRTAGGYVVGPPDLASRDLNGLNKRTEITTGWSYHGARWLAPETGRWLSVDPPTKTPTPQHMVSPWGLHPYQYVDQNPVQYWDPDGHDKVLLYVGMGEHASEEATALTTQVGATGKVVSIYADDGTSAAFTEGTTTYDLSSDRDRKAFALAVAPGSGFLSTRKIMRAARLNSALNDADADTRDELAGVISVYSRAERGQLTIERVVISGHHLAGDDAIYGDGGAEIRLSHFSVLAGVYPAAAGGVKDLGFSACSSLVDADDVATVKSMFPMLDTAWGYKDTCPATRNGAIEHLKKWEAATRGDDSSLTGDEAAGIRKAGNVRVENFE